MLKVAQETNKPWQETLPITLFSVRHTPRGAEKLSPYEILLGFSPKLGTFTKGRPPKEVGLNFSGSPHWFLLTILPACSLLQNVLTPSEGFTSLVVTDLRRNEGLQ
ncbi:unnamed protein product [Ranitomeya imitator]|uniref:Uncharacterized protein n=1 Tax=Ranitomeya imitator TaxID=111125 RepID=A0ABN9L0Z0_9NEOB|nr:unnamed protein product [Ranitomeya imitator]